MRGVSTHGRPKGSFREQRTSFGIIDPETLATDPQVEETIKLALEGRLERWRPLKSYEPERLNARHIAAVLMKAVGLPSNVVAQLTHYTESRLSVILGHPDAQTLLRRCLGKTAVTTATDINARFKAKAPRMQDILEEIAEDEDVKAETRAKCAFGWLDRAGYGATQKTETTHRIVMERSQAERLSSTIREAQEIEEAQYVIVGGASNGPADPAAGDVRPPTSAANSESDVVPVGPLLLPPPKEAVA